MSDKAFKNEIEIIKGFIKDTSTVIMGPEGDSSTVIMGPDMGDSSKGTFNSKLRFIRMVEEYLTWQQGPEQ